MAAGYQKQALGEHRKKNRNQIMKNIIALSVAFSFLFTPRFLIFVDSFV